MDEKTKIDLAKILEETLDKIFEKKFISWFNKGFEEVVSPSMEAMEAELKSEINGVRRELKADINGARAELGSEINGLKFEVNGVKHEMSEVKERLTNVEDKLDEVVLNQGVTNSILKDHGKRIKKLESSQAAA